MPTIDLAIVDNYDDAQEDFYNGSFSTFSGSAQRISVGREYTTYSTTSAETHFGGYRFQLLNIPQGTTIDSATLSMVKSNVDATAGVKIYGNDVDNAQAWANPGNLIHAIAKTAASVALDAASATSSNDVTSIVQEIVNRAGWVSNNAIAFGLFNTNTDVGNHIWQGWAYEKGGAFIPSLSVTYTSGASAPIWNPLTGPLAPIGYVS